MRIIDISEPISPATAVWPGDTPFSSKWVMRMEEGCSCNVSTVTMSVHCGSHADAPFHFDPDGKTVDRLDLAKYLGRCRVVAVTPEGLPPAVPLSAISGTRLSGVARVLFKTQSSHRADHFDPSFCSLGPVAAARLAEAGLDLVGIDTPSMDHFESKDLPSHRTLLRAGVAILENLDLSRVDPGDYELIALPLRILGGDSSPVRAVLRTLDP